MERPLLRRGLSEAEAERAIREVAPRTFLHDACGPSLCCVLVVLCWVVVAGLLPASWGRTLDAAVREEMILDSPDAPGFASFMEDEEDSLAVRVFFFHVANSAGIVHRGETPEVVELGPFTYRVGVEHHNVSWSEDRDNVYFVEHERYYFDRQRSLAPDSTPITSVSIPFQIIITFCSAIGGDSLVNFVIALLLGNDPKKMEEFLFTTKSVRDHLFGYFDGDDFSRTPEFHLLLAFLSFLLHERIDYYPAFIQNFTTSEECFRANGYDALHTGRVRQDLMHYTLWYHNYSSLPPWGSPEARLVGGSDGHFFGRERVKSKKDLEIWIPELSAHGLISPTGEIELIDGIKTDRYVLSKTTFQNASQYPPNADYYQFGPNGLFNLSILTSGLPLSVSKPHFLDGDPILWSEASIKGVSEPDPDIHDTIYHIHHCTGVGFQVSQRFQYNVRLEPLLDFAPWMHDKAVVVPIFWMETVDRVSAKHNHQFHRADELDSFIELLAESGKYGGILCLICTIVLSVMTQHDVVIMEENIALLNEDHPDDDALEAANQSGPRPGVKFFNGSGNLVKAWASFVITTMLINIFIGYATWGVGNKTIEVWKTDPELHTSTTIQIILTISLVGFFSCVTGTLEARREIVWRSKNKIHVMHSALLQGSQQHPLFLGWKCALLCLVCFGLPILSFQYIAICNSFHDECSVVMWHFIFSKAAIAGFEGLIVFFLSARLILESAIPAA